MAERAAVKELFIPGQLVLIRGLTPRPELNCRPSPLTTTCTYDALLRSRLAGQRLELCAGLPAGADKNHVADKTD